jgi:hypothetical protein
MAALISQVQGSTLTEIGSHQRRGELGRATNHVSLTGRKHWLRVRRITGSQEADAGHLPCARRQSRERVSPFSRRSQ